MGTFSVQLEVGNPSHEEFVAVEALVDTGAIYTMLPEDLLDRLSVPRLETDIFELADDSLSNTGSAARQFAFKDGRCRCPWSSPAPTTHHCWGQQPWRSSGWWLTR